MPRSLTPGVLAEVEQDPPPLHRAESESELGASQREKGGTPVAVGSGKGGKGVLPPLWKTMYAKSSTAAMKISGIGVTGDITGSWLVWVGCW